MKIFSKRFLYENNKKRVFPIEPFRMKRRYLLQQSVFISTGIAEVPLMDQLHFLDSDIEKAVVKSEIPTGPKKKRYGNFNK